MDGAELKKKLLKLNVNYSEMATALGYKSRQALNSKLASKDITVSFLLEICGYVNKSIYFFIPKQAGNLQMSMVEEESEPYGNSVKLKAMERTIENLNELITKQKEEIEALKKMRHPVKAGAAN